jgi:quercetin dioxygenase-like cupin family protein
MIHDDGSGLPWLGGSRFVVRLAGAASSGRMTLIEFRCDAGYTAATHVHAHEDEIFVVLEGAMRADLDGRDFLCGAGESVWLPRQRPHGFTVTQDGTRLLHVSTPGGLDEFFTSACGLLGDDLAVQALARTYGVTYL